GVALGSPSSSSVRPSVCPSVCPRSREPSGTPRPSFVPREGEGPAGGSLSDSSSGESGCAPRRPRGPSPSRVRFEDESARDAEVRYLERLRHRRPLGSALERASSEAHAQLGDGGGSAKAQGGDVPAGGKCRACGSLLGAAQPAESSPVARGRERGGSGAAQPEPKTRPLGPGGSPLWILPSRQRIHTEKIKETYIGDARRADEADSALESTDTSDSCRTDSEEPAGGSRVPAPPVTSTSTTKKACSQVPCRKNLASSRRCPEPDAGAASPKPEGAGQRRGPCGPIWLPGSPLRALSTNNCNNTRGQDGRGAGGGGAPPQPGAEPSGDAAGTPRAQQDGSTAPGEPARAVSRKGSGASASSGLKKLLSSLSQSTKQRLGRFRCYSMEQLPAPGRSPGVERSPSLQSLVSPFCQPRKAASAQSLQALLGKAPRASAYLLPQPGPGDRMGASGPRRSLSVEDIGAPGLPRTVGRVVEVFPDGTSQLELQRPPHGSFGFLLTSGHGRPDTGVYVQEMSDAGTAKLYAGLLGVGDEILQVNGAAVSGLGLARIRELLLRADSLSLRVLRQRPARR
uniref:PDZ domain-containing protein n=1 Tax=Cairina moschata TaxID=8855 RepID=A0A8C3GRC1_CAIMO